MTESFSLPHLLYRRREEYAAPPPALLLLHGLGSNEGDLMGLAPYLDPRLFIVSVRALRPYGYGGYAWFDLSFTGTTWTYDPEEAEAARRRLSRFVGEAVAEYALDPARVMIAGFSQGAAMALSVALTEPSRFAGIAALSGVLMPETLAGIAPPGELDRLPVFAAHGLHDGVVPVAFGRQTRERLQTLPVRLEYREYPMAHEITPASLNDLQEWLSQRLEETSGRP